jgi:two-component system, NarL family, response regulator DesR
MRRVGDRICMTAIRPANQVLIVEPDSRVRRALADLVDSTDGLVVLAACASVDDVEAACRDAHPDAALVGVRLACEHGFAAVTRLAQQVPVVAVAPVGSVASRAIAAGAAAFYDEDGDADALVAVIREVTDRPKEMRMG